MYFMFHLYGPMPAILDPNQVSSESAQQNIVRPTLDEMSQWIYDDIKKAISLLPETVSEKGRYTADYARFCLMKHCLNEGEHMPGWYEEGLDMFDLLNNGKYDLVRTGSSTVPNPFLNVFSYYNKWNSEIVSGIFSDHHGVKLKTSYRKTLQTCED